MPLSTLYRLFTVRATRTPISCLWLKPFNNTRLCSTTINWQSKRSKCKNQNISSLPSPDETDRQRKDALRQKVGLKTLPAFTFGLLSIFNWCFFFYTPVAFTWNEFSSMNTIWRGWRAYGVVDMIKLSQCKRTSRRSASMCPEPRS